MARSTTAGPSTPTIPLRVATENSTARLVKASIGNADSSHATATSARECPIEKTVPLRLTSGCAPTSSTPAARLDSVRSASSPSANVATASTLPANTCRRVHDRVSMVFQVPWRSSAANRSPASTPAISGRPQAPANPSTNQREGEPRRVDPDAVHASPSGSRSAPSTPRRTRTGRSGRSGPVGGGRAGWPACAAPPGRRGRRRPAGFAVAAPKAGPPAMTSVALTLPPATVRRAPRAPPGRGRRRWSGRRTSTRAG